MTLFRALIVSAFAPIAIGACGQSSPGTPVSIEQPAEPPPNPEGAETVEFDRTTESQNATEESEAQAATSTRRETTYWGVKEGEALPLMWEDLMPEGSEEELIQEYEEFYAMLEKRYAANMTTLADADPYAAIAEGSALDMMPQLGTFDTVDELHGAFVRIPGYVVPFEFNSKKRQQEFLFVPYMGACIHSPPPPPNQIIFVRADPAVRVKDIWAPYWIEGTLSPEKNENEVGDAAYTMSLSSIEPYPIP